MMNALDLPAVALPFLVTLVVAILTSILQLLLAGGVASLALLAGFVIQRVVVVDVSQVGMVRPVTNIRSDAIGSIATRSRTWRRHAASPHGQSHHGDHDEHRSDRLRRFAELLSSLVAQPHAWSVGLDAAPRYAATCGFPDRDRTVARGGVL